jgi:phosphoglycerol transferase MdoB-like AlkP superfamily enzyme
MHQYSSQIDLAPTLLDLMGIEIPQYFIGKSMFRGGSKFAFGYLNNSLYVTDEDKSLTISLTETGITGENVSSAFMKWFKNINMNVVNNKVQAGP